MKKDADLLEYFIANERKQKRITLITSILFSLFAITIIGLGIYAHNQKTIIENKNKDIYSLNDSLQKTNDALDILNDKLNIANSNLKQDTLTLNRTANNYEKKNIEIQEALLKIAKNPNPPRSNNTRPVITDNTYEDGAVLGTNPNNTASTGAPIYPSKAIKDILNKNYTTNYVLYIQYMDGQLGQAQKLNELYLEKKYTIPKLQNIKKIRFKSSVRYFYPNDKEKALQIAKLAEEKTELKYNVQYLKLKSPKNQLEIWVGK